MTGLLLRYNKIHNESLDQLSLKLKKEFSIILGDMSSLGTLDLLSYDVVEKYIKKNNPDFVVTGDVFWDAGQNLCQICKQNSIPLFFLQHGQWIYIKNKHKLGYYPYHTFVFGNNTKNMCSEWEYAKHSKITATGSPRYEGALKSIGNYILFCPPVIEELIHGKPSGTIRNNFLQNLKALSGIDKDVSMVIQPHYREARIEWLQDMFPNAQFADPDLSTFKLIRGASKILASRNSTTILDAIAYYKPIVLSDLPEYDMCFYKRNYFGDFALENKTKQMMLKNLCMDIKIGTHNYAERAKSYIILGDASGRITENIKQGIIEYES